MPIKNSGIQIVNIQEIETAAFNACPAQNQSILAGIVIRSNGGFTKRANSATLLADSNENTMCLIETCESYFAAKGQPGIFRLLSVFDVQKSDRHLRDKGYGVVEPTNVMLQKMASVNTSETSIERLPLPEWIETFYQISEDDDGFRQQHLSMCQNITSPYFAAVIRNKQNNVVSMGLGVVENGYFGIFNIVTNKGYKQQGYSYRLITGLFNWAKSIQAHTAYVQVRQANTAAVNLYRKLGYAVAYHYWYRVGGDRK